MVLTFSTQTIKRFGITLFLLVAKFAEKVLGNRALTLTCCESEDEEAKKFSKRTAYVETGVNLADLSASLDGIKPTYL